MIKIIINVQQNWKIDQFQDCCMEMAKKHMGKEDKYI